MIIRVNNNQEHFSDEQLEAHIDFANKIADVVTEGEYADVLMRHALSNSYVSLTYVDRDEIHEINKETRNIDKETDVLSFPLLDMEFGSPISELSPEDFEYDEDGEQILNLGDILICVPVAVEHANEYGHSVEREFAFLVAHSILHLLGYDHMNEDDEKVMISKQKEIMCSIGLAFDDEEEFVTEMTRHEDESSVIDNLEKSIAYPAGSICSHCGYAAILGRPNVGKSTLLNYITGMKVAIVSHKPQTTRTNIRSIYNTDDSQIIFVDTPGVHKPESKLGEIMVGNSFAAVKGADAVILMADGRFNIPGKVELSLIDLCRENNKKVILVINKSDDVEKESLLPAIAEYSKLYDFVDIIPVSAKTGDNVQLLLDSICNLLPEGPRLFDSEYMTDQTEREIAAELIREQLLHYTNQEVPHGIAVEINEFKEKMKPNAVDEYDRDMVVINASIICERESHRAIILGKKGQMIKRIGTAARKNIERLCECKVYLDLFVKVRGDWKNNDILLKDYGFHSEEEK